MACKTKSRLKIYHLTFGIYKDIHDAQLKAAEIRGRIERGETKSFIIGAEEYSLE
jgi:hypothetical protein